MSFQLLFTDELKGFYKSKVMIFLWIGLPLLAFLLHISTSSQGGEIPISLLTSILVSSIGGLLGAIMLTVNIVNEKDTHAFDLFLIRPIKRWYLLLSKFLAVYICVSIACIIAILFGVFIDTFESKIFFNLIIENIIESFIMTISVIGISSAVGILIGVISPSILVGVILVIFIGNYIASIPTLPLFLNLGNQVLMVILFGAVLTFALMFISMLIFNKKEF
jgi:hypothetical protein